MNCVQCGQKLKSGTTRFEIVGTLPDGSIVNIFKNGRAYKSLKSAKVVIEKLTGLRAELEGK